MPRAVRRAVRRRRKGGGRGGKGGKGGKGKKIGTYEEFADGGRAFGRVAARLDLVREAGDFLVAFFDHHQIEHTQLRTHHTAAHGLALALTGAAGAVTRVTCTCGGAGQPPIQPSTHRHSTPQHSTAQHSTAHA
jgi:hypothetical protein